MNVKKTYAHLERLEVTLSRSELIKAVYAYLEHAGYSVQKMELEEVYFRDDDDTLTLTWRAEKADTAAAEESE
jgi:hypothetical protein